MSTKKKLYEYKAKSRLSLNPKVNGRRWRLNVHITTQNLIKKSGNFKGTKMSTLIFFLFVKKQ